MIGYDRYVPYVKHYSVRAYKGSTINKTFRVTNKFGEPFNFSGENIVGYASEDNFCYCPPIEICCTAVGENCSEINMHIDQIDSAKMKLSSYYFRIDLNPYVVEEDRETKVMEIAELGIDRDLPFSTYISRNALLKELPKVPTYRLVEGILDIRC